MLLDIKSLSIGTLDQNTAKGQNGYRALEQATFHYNDFYRNNYVIINVEGYDCIAHYKNENPDDLELDEIIFPYDENRIYPIQALELKYRFKLY